MFTPAPPPSNEEPIGNDGSAVLAAERRGVERIAVSLPATLVDPCGTEPVPCSATCVAEGGVRLQVPASSGVGVGQRFEVRFPEGSVPANLAGLRAPGIYGTVVRTEPTDKTDVLGVGFRFDQPVYL